MADPVALVMAELETVGYLRLPKPLVVAGATFDFDAAAAGTERSHDLVVVAGPEVDFRRLAQLLGGLARRLDHLGSRRPMSLVLIGERPAPADSRALDNFARVLSVEGVDPSPDSIRDAIGVLLPLQIGQSTASALPPLDRLRKGLSGRLTERVEDYLEAALDGERAVEARLVRQVDEALADGGNDA